MRLKHDKRERNEAYADRFPRHLKKQCKAERRKRVELREARWLAAMGIERNPAYPLA